MTQNYKDAHNHKDEILIPYNSTIKLGVLKRMYFLSFQTKENELCYV